MIFLCLFQHFVLIVFSLQELITSTKIIKKKCFFFSLLVSCTFCFWYTSNDTNNYVQLTIFEADFVIPLGVFFYFLLFCFLFNFFHFILSMHYIRLYQECFLIFNQFYILLSLCNALHISFNDHFQRGIAEMLLPMKNILE